MISKKDAISIVQEALGYKANFDVRVAGKWFLFCFCDDEGKQAIANSILFDRETGDFRAFYPPTEPKDILEAFEKRR